ncbi:hypothetical protein HK104_002706 [Borealophlyctis nickersoniae]|nr:hypothetical protein HK104_002706 [Borealophlyctis nickersoniae]
MFETFYDNMEEAPRLSATLREQIRKATALLQTLQGSGQMIEGLVRGHFREMQVQYGEKFGAALTDLHRRLCVVEERVGVSAGAGSATAPQNGFGGRLPSASINGPSGDGKGMGLEKMLESLAGRMESLEKKMGGEK